MRLLTLTLIFTLPLAAVAQDKKKPEPPAAPKILYPIPFVLPAGPKGRLALRGLRLDAVKEVKASDPDVKVKFVAARKASVPNNRSKDREGDSEVEIELELPKELKPGLTLEAIGPAGTSGPYTVLANDDLPRTDEKEPNDGFAVAQRVPLPSAVVGTVRAEKDVDVFRFDGKKGQAVRLEVQAARFGSPLDATLAVYDADRRVLASADDIAGSADPTLTVTLPRDGAYFVSVMDANDLGGGNFGYRLVLRPSK